MAASQTILGGWLGLITLLWSCQPLLFSHTRGVVLLAVATALLALVGWLLGVQLLVVWSGGLGLVNLTMTLALTGQAPNVWVGLSAGIALLALLDGSQRYSYLRRCRVEPGVMMAWLGTFIRLTGLSIAAAVALTLVLVNLAPQGVLLSAAGLLTIVGAVMFVGALALFLRYATRWSAKE
jgi:hypothetical protein